MTRISVCMATYNGQKYIKRQLESILFQLSDQDEVVVSDDKSTDKTLYIISQINDKRIRVSTNIGKQGPMSNFEQALKKATGAFIFLADQDDIWLPNKVEKTLKLLMFNDLVLSDCTVVDGHETILYDSFFRKRGSKKGFWYNLYKNSYIGCCMAFKREVLSYALPFPAHVHMHDWWIGLMVEAKGRVYFNTEPLISYVRHGNNASPTGELGYSITQKIKNRAVLSYYVAKRLLL